MNLRVLILFICLAIIPGILQAQTPRTITVGELQGLENVKQLLPEAFKEQALKGVTISILRSKVNGATLTETANCEIDFTAVSKLLAELMRGDRFWIDFPGGPREPDGSVFQGLAFQVVDN